MRSGVRTGESSAESTSGVQSVDRAISVLEILARRGGAGVSEVAADIGVHKSTAFRLLSALEDRGLVEQTTGRGKYQLGFGVLRLASTIPGRLDLVRQARPVLDELAAELGETVNLAVVRSHYAVNVDQATGSAAVAAQNWVGQLTPLHATSSGKVLLAHLSAETRKQLLDAAGLPRYTKRTLTTRKALDAALKTVLSDGYATTFEEYEDGLNAIAAPVRDQTGAVAGAVSVSGPAYRLDGSRIAKIADRLRSGASRISDRMGNLR
ncbi:MAG TPA: IclR family transcriptional regulator [Mycobacterium sp.]|jgi:DNA-binding IclR family transcriptional regulator|nr:IclR family transcriptional regulator [Micromonosporaceae bacterium]